MSRRRSSRLSAVRLCSADASAPATLLSSVPHALLPLLSTRDARALRATCREALRAVAAFPFDEAGYWSECDQAWHPGTRIGRAGSSAGQCLARWRRCFPAALGANLEGALDLSPEDVRAHLRGLRAVDLSDCAQLTDAHLALMPELQRLVVNGCDQAALTDAAFAHLGGRLRFLVCGNCPQLTSAALAPLRGLETLVCWNCCNERLGDAGLAFLRGLRTLVMGGCDQPAIGDATLVALGGSLERLLMWGCTQPTITDAGLARLRRVATLDMRGCCQATITGAAFEHLPALRVLNLAGCTQLTDACFEHLAGVEELDVSHCPGLDGSGLVHLAALRELRVQGCSAALRRRARELGLPVVR
jgi:hypothetical protein